MLCVCTQVATYIPGTTLFAIHQFFFLHWSFGQEEKMGRVGEKRRWAAGGRQRWRRGLSPHLSSPASGKAYARDSSALFLYVSRGPGGHPLCFSSPSTLEEVGYASYCIADSYGRPSVCALL